MTALLLAAMLACGQLSIGRAEPSMGSIQIRIPSVTSIENSSAKLLSIRLGAGDELLYFDERGGLHLLRWCTPWDIAWILLQAQRRAPMVDI